jgi:protein-S-isoprenylcysteine O-methyltransferase Ste14
VKTWVSSWRTAVPPPLVTLLMAVLMAWGASSVPPWSGVWALHQALGVAWALSAGVLMLWAALALRRHHTTINPLRPEAAQHLVCTGVYARSRNPIYLADALLLLGWWLWLGEPVLGVGLVGFVLWMDRVQIRAEERALGAHFGAAYANYCARVRRWL